MVAALAGRELGAQVNRKSVQRLMREHRLLQRRRAEGRPRRPGSSASSARISSLACRHDLDLGRRARLVPPERRDRLLHARDRRLGA